MALIGPHDYLVDAAEKGEVRVGFVAFRLFADWFVGRPVY
jgi:hypothetical protein